MCEKDSLDKMKKLMRCVRPKIICFLFLLCLSASLFSLERFTLQSPVDYYITDTRTGYNIILGGSYYYFEIEYVKPLSQKPSFEINTDVCYLRFFNEINRDGEETLLYFFIDENLKITKLSLYVDTGV